MFFEVILKLNLFRNVGFVSDAMVFSVSKGSIIVPFQ